MPRELLPQKQNPNQMEGPNQEFETDRTTFLVTQHQKRLPTLTNETKQTSAIISMMTSMTSLVKKVLDMDQKGDVSKKPLEQYSAESSSAGIDIFITTQ